MSAPIHTIIGGCLGLVRPGFSPQDNNSRVSLLGAGRIHASAAATASKNPIAARNRLSIAASP